MKRLFYLTGLAVAALCILVYNKALDWGLTAKKACIIMVLILIGSVHLLYYGILGRPWIWDIVIPKDAGFFWPLTYDIFWYMELPAGYLVGLIALVLLSIISIVNAYWGRKNLPLIAEPRSVLESIIHDEATHFTMEEFVVDCNGNLFTDDDGYARYATDTHMYVTERIYPSSIVSGDYDKSMTHVVWINR